MTEIDGEEEAYLELPEEHLKKVALPETVWAQISEDGKIAVLRWDIIDMYAVEFDVQKKLKKEPAQAYIICKLLTLVRDQVRKECLNVEA
jgi:hypothetical protein